MIHIELYHSVLLGQSFMVKFCKWRCPICRSELNFLHLY